MQLATRSVSEQIQRKIRRVKIIIAMQGLLHHKAESLLRLLFQALVFCSINNLAVGHSCTPGPNASTNDYITILQPSDLSVDIGSQATFRCNVSCELSRTHTIRWFVGNQRGGKRAVDSNFHQRTGIQVEIEKMSNCARTGVQVEEQTLRINITSAEILNKTAIQCAALKKRPSIPDYFSNYAMLMVNDIVETSTFPPLTSSQEEVTEVKGDEDVVSTTTIAPTQTVIVTVTKTMHRTVTVTRTVQPTNGASLCDNETPTCNDALRITDSLILVYLLAITSLWFSLLS